MLPILQPFNGVNTKSVVVLDNASIHHVEKVRDLIETQVGSKLCFLPPYSPDLNPAEGVLSQVKSIMKKNDELFQVYSAPRARHFQWYLSMTALVIYHTVDTYKLCIKQCLCMASVFCVFLDLFQFLENIHDGFMLDIIFCVTQ